MSHLIWIYIVCKFDCFMFGTLTLLHSEQPKLYGVLAVLSAIKLSAKCYIVQYALLCMLCLFVCLTVVVIVSNSGNCSSCSPKLACKIWEVQKSFGQCLIFNKNNVVHLWNSAASPRKCQ